MGMVKEIATDIHKEIFKEIPKECIEKLADEIPKTFYCKISMQGPASSVWTNNPILPVPDFFYKAIIYCHRSAAQNS